jgi:hypothetical protein
MKFLSGFITAQARMLAAFQFLINWLLCTKCLHLQRDPILNHIYLCVMLQGDSMSITEIAGASRKCANSMASNQQLVNR